MPNQITANGLETKTVPEIVTEILDGTPDYPGMRSIYGADINVAPNSPDGQMVNIIAQVAGDQLDFITQVYNSFNPDVAIGRVLDQRCAYNGVVRRAGTYTQTNVTVTTDRALTLMGTEDDPTGAFTVQNNAGKQFDLVNTAVIGAAGAHVLLFKAVDIGAVETVPNTITVVRTITLGVVSVNNPSAAIVTGVNEESDTALRVRRQQSVSLPSVGYFEGLIGGLLGVSGVTDALVIENPTGSTDANGIPAHSIWCIVQGGTDADIANMIYLKRNAGAGMKGSEVVTLVQVDGSNFDIQFDRPSNENLWIKFNVTAITGLLDETFIRAQLLDRLSYGINQSADTTTIVSLVREISPTASVSAEGVSDDNITYVSLLAPATKDVVWQIAAARIIINGLPG